MIKYRVTKYSDKIKSVKIEKETEHYVKPFDSKWKELKHCYNHRYFNSFEEAKDYLIEREEKNLQYAQKEVKHALCALERVKRLRP